MPRKWDTQFFKKRGDLSFQIFRTLAISCFLSLVASGVSIASSTNCDPSAERVFQQAKVASEEGQHLLAAIHFSLASRLFCDQPHQLLGQYLYAWEIAKLGESGAAIKTLLEVRSQTSDPQFRHRLNLSLASLEPNFENQLEPADQVRFHLWEKRFEAAAFAKATGELTDSALKASLTPVADRMQAMPIKKPWVAGVSSAIVPGLGQVYNGNYQSAALSFLINALFLSAALELSRQGLPATSLAAGAVFSVTYLGNIVSSVQSAQAINRHQMKTFEPEIQNTLFPELRGFENLK